MTWQFCCNRCGFKWVVDGIVNKKDWECPNCHHKFQRAIEQIEDSTNLYILRKLAGKALK